MYCLKNLKATSTLLAFTSLALLTVSCSVGLNGGSITGVFTGINAATVKGPQSVEINWDTNLNCVQYQIYQLSSSTSNSVATASIPPVVLGSPTVQSQHTYNFAVGCVDSSQNITGLSVSQTVTTWANFNGLVTSSLDTTGNNTVVNLTWSYPASTGTVFQIYAEKSIVPNDLSTWQLTQTGGVGTAYAQTDLICQVYQDSANIGPGGNCSNASLESGSTYNFKVVALYPDGTYSTDIMGNGTTIAVPSSFTPPACVLTKDGIGPDPTHSYLTLRCSANASGNSSNTCPIGNISYAAYQAINGTKTPISTTLTGPGTLLIQPTVGTTPNDRIVKDLEIDYQCSNPNALAIVRYDGSNPLYPQPSLKYGSSNYEAAPPPPTSNPNYLNPSYIGSAFAIGDFNCDGKPDLAVGLPKVAYNYPPYQNQNVESGAVKIYYDYSLNASGAITSTSTEYISFRDLPTFAHFGQSLSAGNINKDVSLQNGKFYSCDDLIIGAPGDAPVGGNGHNTAAYQGYAYIFYGQPQGFPQPLDSAGLASDAPTCSGGITSEVCAPVRLQPEFNMTTYFHVDPSETNRNEGVASNIAANNVGYSVAYIRDFNADGYGDVAIGNPNCQWDGDNVNGDGSPFYSAPPSDVGCVYVYWGGPQGLQNVTVGHTPDYPTGSVAATLTAPFVKIYPPIPQSNMFFGTSISGGGDVDGRLPVPVEQNGGPGMILANGDDFVVGAPGFTYTGSSTGGSGDGGEIGLGSQMGWTVNENVSAQTCGISGSGTTCRVDPIVLQGPSSYAAVETTVSNKMTAPWNGAWTAPAAWNGSYGYPTPTNANLLGSTGIAFLYRGRSAHVNYPINLTPNSTGKFTLLPNDVNSVSSSNNSIDQAWSVSGSMSQLLSANIQDRQNGSQFLTSSIFSTPSTLWQEAPVDSFYNCGSRGSPIGASVAGNGSAGGTFKHVSCLAGRNNFSILYPLSNAAVQGFGQNVAIAGPAEQNAVALYQEGSSIPGTGYYSYQTPGGLSTLMPLAQVNTHSGIRGTSLWELGIQGLTTRGAQSSCEVTNNVTSNSAGSQFSASGCVLGGSSTYIGYLGRSMLDESYSNFPSAFWNTVSGVAPISDINRDGYADVLITANNQLYTFFGNYAADFSYQDALTPSYSTSANCTVTQTPLAGGASNFFATSSGMGGAYDSSVTPFSTFFTRSSGISPEAYTITGEYPASILPDASYGVRAAMLGDISSQFAASSGIIFDYPPARTGTVGSNCLPQVKTYANGAPTSLALADVNADGLLDVITGFGSASSGNGTIVISTSSSIGGRGLASDNSVNLGPSITNADFGQAVAAANWEFVGTSQNNYSDESSRRDIFAGAPGYQIGSGAGYLFSSTGNNTLNTTLSAPLLENSNTPSYLYAEHSKIIGDINGDGYDDIWVPVKRLDASGNPFFDAIIYFGSAYGPVTYTTCMNEATSITLANGGGSISTADCLGTTQPQAAILNGTPILLPQYITKPASVGANWALFPFPAGDVNADTFQDLVFFDNISGNNSIYLFFGSASGLSSGVPVAGASLNNAPQIVTQNSEFTLATMGVGQSPWQTIQNDLNGYAQSQHPVVHGDFNGDGYADIAFSVYLGTEPSYGGSGATATATAWTCAPTTGPVVNCPPPGGGPAFGNFNGPEGGTGYVIVIYGGPNGYQTPTNSNTGIAADFPNIDETCTDLLSNCIANGSSGAGLYTTMKSPYGTLQFNSASKTYSLNANATACTPGGTGSASICSGTYIRSPIFYNESAGLEMYGLKGISGFGMSLTVADANNDGIDDLIVGFPDGSHGPGWSNFISSNVSAVAGTSATISGQSGDNPGKGMVFVYYGAKDAGIVAPNAGSMLGDLGMGLDGSADMLASPNNHVLFQLYPTFPASVPSGGWPELDGSNGDANRHFGMAMTTGDFNGDGIDDVAISSGNGQVYVYYGPLCPVDNTKDTLNNFMYANHNQACQTSTNGVALGNGICGNTAPPATLSGCVTFNLNLEPANLSTITPSQASSKPLYPQMIYMQGSTSSNGVGTTLLSERPIRSPASTTIVQNRGSINGSVNAAGNPVGTSDLVVGAGGMQDPNVSSGQTGVGYVYFGHKAPVNNSTDMNTLPGLYVVVGGSFAYNSNVVSQNLGTGTNAYYFYSPVMLKPHTSDGSIGGFFSWETTMGDLNHDGTADLVMPTQNINFGASNAGNSAEVVYGGGFKLFY